MVGDRAARVGALSAAPATELYRVDDLVGFLAGSWRIDREYRDGGGHLIGAMTGTGHYTPDTSGLRYTERGTLNSAGYRGEGERRYRLIAQTASRAAIRFEDGRPFHMLDLSSGRAEVLHLCGDDRYGASYRAFGLGRWTLRWVVSGPRKEYAIESEYTRAIIAGQPVSSAL